MTPAKMNGERARAYSTIRVPQEDFPSPKSLGYSCKNSCYFNGVHTELSTERVLSIFFSLSTGNP